jgi:predicted dehydrogenase
VVRIAVIGAGAVTKVGHLPASQRVQDATITALVDRDTNRAQQLADQYSIPHVLQSIEGVQDIADAAVIALPHALHAPVGVELLQRGLHVLVEKPMAVTAAECDSLAQTAREHKRVLAVGLMRRFAPWAACAHAMITGGHLGTIQACHWRDGARFAWPTATDAPFRKDAGGGVLIDAGSHTLDLVLWWLGPVAQLNYKDDAAGGVEADCELRLTMESGATALLEFSRTRDLGNIVTVTGSHGTLRVVPFEDRVELLIGGEILRGSVVDRSGVRAADYLALMTSSMHDFVDAIREQRPPFIGPEEGKKSVALIEACYKTRQPLELPWLSRAAS